MRSITIKCPDGFASPAAEATLGTTFSREDDRREVVVRHGAIEDARRVLKARRVLHPR